MLRCTAGVAQWQSSSLPSWLCGFDSRHPLCRSKRFRAWRMWSEAPGMDSAMDDTPEVDAMALRIAQQDFDDRVEQLIAAVKGDSSALLEASQRLYSRGAKANSAEHVAFPYLAAAFDSMVPGAGPEGAFPEPPYPLPPHLPSRAPPPARSARVGRTATARQ